MTIRYRGLISFLLVVGAMLCGFALGSFIGGRFFVPAGSGLAGPVMVLGYGLIGAFVLGAVALVPVFRLQGGAYLMVAVPIIVAGTILAGVITHRILETKSEHDAYLASQRASLPPYTLTVEYLLITEHTPFARFEFDSRERVFRILGTDQSVCRGTFEASSEDKLTLLVALRHIEGLLADDPSPCDNGVGDENEPVASVSFSITESRPPETSGDILIDGNCLRRHSELIELLETVEVAQENLQSQYQGGSD
jgi:hypothetical protein